MLWAVRSLAERLCVGVQEAASYVNGVTITVDGGFSAALSLPEPTAKL